MYPNVSQQQPWQLVFTISIVMYCQGRTQLVKTVKVLVQSLYFAKRDIFS